jgi:hypothetical protein
MSCFSVLVLLRRHHLGRTEKRFMMVHMNTNGKRLRTLIEGAGLTQENALELFNNSRPRLFDPYSISAWKAFLADADSARWRPFGDRLMERAEKIFSPMKKQY